MDGSGDFFFTPMMYHTKCVDKKAIKRLINMYNETNQSGRAVYTRVKLSGDCGSPYFCCMLVRYLRLYWKKSVTLLEHSG